MDETVRPTPRPKQLPSLQVLRFIAAFMVVLFHVGVGIAEEFQLPGNVFGVGASGVDIFFVLSGFVIAYTTDTDRGAGYFAIRRIARIVPLYWFLTTAIIAIALVLPQLLNSTTVTPEAVIKSYLFIPYDKASGAMQPILFLGWTLCYEMFFYGIFTLAILGTGRYAPLSASIAIGLIVLAGVLFPGGPRLWQFYSNPVMLEFMLGVGLWLAFSRAPRLLEGSLPLAVALVAAGIFSYAVDLGLPWPASSALPAGLVVAGFLCLRLPAIWPVSLLVLLGDASYSLYLSHPYIIQAPIKLVGERIGFTATAALSVASVLVAIGVSVALYRMVEKPAQRLILGLYRARGGQKVTLRAPAVNAP